ncbi:MAG: hypothetical protein SFT68_05645 [Rickettsiaceae bacterium]|nr:hypothetical protein [Rickettsiaceae bacterium]
MSELNRILFWPYVRNSIQRYFGALLDEEFKKTWFSTTAKHRFSDSLDYYVFGHLLFLNPDIVDNDGNEAIGIVLYNKEEAVKISKYINFYIDTFECNMPDSYYINHPRWNEVIDGAREIVEMMQANNIKYNLAHDIEEWDKFNDIYPFSLDENEISKTRLEIEDRHFAECRKRILDLK